MRGQRERPPAWTPTAQLTTCCGPQEAPLGSHPYSTSSVFKEGSQAVMAEVPQLRGLQSYIV